MTTSTSANKSLVPWWVRVVANGIAILLGIVLLALTPALNLQIAWRRARLRRAVRQAWPAAVRFLVQDDGGAWGVLLREEWLPHHTSATILIPPAEEPGASAEERLARRVFNEWGSFHKTFGPAVAVVVMSGKELVAVRVTSARGTGAIPDAERLRQRLQAMVAFGCS